MPTNIESGNALTSKLWALENEKLFRDAMKQSYFLPRFGSTDKNSVVYIKNELEKESGDRITFGIRMRLTGSGVGPGQTLEGNEEQLTLHNYSLNLTRRRHAVRVERGLTEQRIKTQLEPEAKMAIQDWMAEYIDDKLFEALRSTPTVVWYNNNGAPTKGASASAVKSDINSAQDKVTPKLLSAIRTWAITGGNRSQVPIRPIMVDGRKTYIFLAHPDVIYDLKNDSTYAQAQREAADRGKDNPIFTGAVGVWDNVVVHEHENILIGADAGSGSDQPYAECSLLGAQSLCFAFGKRKNQIVTQEFDYKEEVGYSIGLNYGAGKPVFNGKDYGSIGVYVGRTQISDL